MSNIEGEAAVSLDRRLGRALGLTLVPLFPLAIDLVATSEIQGATLAVTAAIYAMSHATTTRSHALRVVTSLLGGVSLTIHGAIFLQDKPPTTIIWSALWVTIATVLGLMLIEELRAN